MKITQASYDKLSQAVTRAAGEVNFTCAEYVAEGLGKDPAKRYRWDLLWYATAKILPPSWVCRVLYNEEGLVDTHIDTALKHIVKGLPA